MHQHFTSHLPFLHSSFDDYIQELIPIGGFESTQTHCKSLDFFDQCVLNIQLLHLLLVLLCQFDFNEEFFDHVVELVASHLLLALLIYLFHFSNNFALFTIGVYHVGIEETTYLFIIIFQTFQDQQLWYDEKDLCVSLLELLSKLSVLLSSCLNNLRKVE